MAVLEALATAEGHLSAEDVCARIAPVLPGVDRATVYRALETLAELGLVTLVHLGHGATVHHLAGEREGKGHLHAHCRRCGRVVDVEGDLLDEVRLRLAREAGFDLEPRHVALSGTCALCRAGDGADAVLDVSVACRCSEPHRWPRARGRRLARGVPAHAPPGGVAYPGR